MVLDPSVNAASAPNYMEPLHATQTHTHTLSVTLSISTQNASSRMGVIFSTYLVLVTLVLVPLHGFLDSCSPKLIWSFYMLQNLPFTSSVSA